MSIKRFYFIKMNIFMFFLVFIPSAAYGQNDAFTIKINDSQDKKPIQEANVIINRKGQQWEYGTNIRGLVDLRPPEFIDDRQTQITIEADGFIPLTDKCPCNQRTYSLSKKMKVGYRIVLNWGNDPLDLDAHLWLGDDHVYYNSMTGEHAELDMDERDSFGPETVTIDKKLNKRYIYAVHDYTNRKSGYTKKLSFSRAKVYFYQSNQNRFPMVFQVPTGINGTKWVVFYIDQNDQVHVINRIIRQVAGDSRGTVY